MLQASPDFPLDLSDLLLPQVPEHLSPRWDRWPQVFPDFPLDLLGLWDLDSSNRERDVRSRDRFGLPIDIRSKNPLPFTVL